MATAELLALGVAALPVVVSPDLQEPQPLNTSTKMRLLHLT
jgi:hypothetical protein